MMVRRTDDCEKSAVCAGVGDGDQYVMVRTRVKRGGKFEC